MAISKAILEELMKLDPIEKAQLVDQLICTLDKPDSELDKLWAKKAESRLEAYKQGKIKTVSLQKALSKYQ